MMTGRDHPPMPIEDCEPKRRVVADSRERASAIIIESIPPERKEEYLRWVREITRAAESFS